MRASVLGTGHWLPARARVKVGRSAHFRRQPGRQPACMHCMHKNRLNFSDLCVIMHAEFWLAGWLAGWLLAGWPLRRGMALECARACSNLRDTRAPQKNLHAVLSGKAFGVELRGAIHFRVQL